MTTISHDPVTRVGEPRAWITVFAMSEVWASLAIAVIWLAVLFTSVYASNLVSTTAGGDSTSIPAGIAVALFATIATWPIAKYGYRHDSKS